MGSLRWEVEARGDWLGKAGMSVVSRWNPARVSAMAQERWEWSEMGATVQGPRDVLDVIRRGLTDGTIRSPAMGYALAGYLLAESDGRMLPASKWTTNRMRAMARDLGVFLQASEEPAQVEVARRLDFAAGREVAA